MGYLLVTLKKNTRISSLVELLCFDDDEAFGYFNLNWKKYVKIDKARFRPNEVVKLIGDSSAAQKDLGWIPERISFRRHIEMMCDWDFKLESGQKPERIDVFI